MYFSGFWNLSGRFSVIRQIMSMRNSSRETPSEYLTLIYSRRTVFLSHPIPLNLTPSLLVTRTSLSPTSSTAQFGYNLLIHFCDPGFINMILLDDVEERMEARHFWLLGHTNDDGPVGL